MGGSRQKDGTGGLYERLLQRLAQALDEADSLNRLSADVPRELELRDLSPAEVELIRAYLDRDLNWLRGWHAAAQELALLEQRPGRGFKAGRAPVKHGDLPAGKSKPLLRRRLQLCCALCNTLADWQPGRGVHACKACGSQLFRAANPR
ncbi:hypothetical protein ACX0MV_18625 [Pseudomonas borbori]